MVRIVEASTSGVSAERVASLVPSAITLPLRMCCSPEDSTNTPYSMLLPSRSVVSGAAPLYGTCTRSSFALPFTRSPSMCSEVPLPALP